MARWRPVGRGRWRRCGASYIGATALVMLGACAGDDPTRSETSGARLGTTVVGGSPPPSTEPPPPLADGATAAQLAAAVDAVFDPAIDPLVALNALFDTPTDLPLPDGAGVVELKHRSTAATDQGTAGEAETSIALWTPASAADAATLYRTALPGIGWEVIGGSPPEQEDDTQTIDAAPADGTDSSTLTVFVFDVTAANADDRITSPVGGSQVTLTLREPERASVLARFDEWSGSLRPEGPIAFIDVMAGSWFDPRAVVKVQSGYTTPGGAADVGAELRAALTDVRPAVDAYGVGEDPFVGATDELDAVVVVAAPRGADAEVTDVEITTCLPLTSRSPDLTRRSEFLVYSSCPVSIGAEADPEPPATPPTTAAPEPVDVTGRRATTDELVAATQRILGPTDDLVSAMAPLVTLPEAVSTPLGTTIEAFDIGIDVSGEAWSTATVTMSTDSPIVDLTTLYDTTLAAAGFLRMQAYDFDASGGRQRVHSYTLEDGGFDDVAEITVSADYAVHNDGRRTFQLDVSDQTDEQGRLPDMQGDLAGDTWALPLEGLAAADVAEWRVATDLGGFSGPRLSFVARYTVPDPSDALERIEANLPTDSTINETITDRGSLYLDRAGYTIFGITVDEFAPEDRPAVRVSADVVFDPPGVD